MPGLLERHKHPGWDGVAAQGQVEKANHCCPDRITAESATFKESVSAQLVKSCTFSVAYVDYQRR